LKDVSLLFINIHLTPNDTVPLKYNEPLSRIAKPAGRDRKHPLIVRVADTPHPLSNGNRREPPPKTGDNINIPAGRKPLGDEDKGVVATKHWKPKEIITYVPGLWKASVNNAIYLKLSKWMYSNHWVRAVKDMLVLEVTRAIKPKEEITTYYSDEYYGVEKECRCRSCDFKRYKREFRREFRNVDGLELRMKGQHDDSSHGNGDNVEDDGNNPSIPTGELEKILRELGYFFWTPDQGDGNDRGGGDADSDAKASNGSDDGNTRNEEGAFDMMEGIIQDLGMGVSAPSWNGTVEGGIFIGNFRSQEAKEEVGSEEDSCLTSTFNLNIYGICSKSEEQGVSANFADWPGTVREWCAVILTNKRDERTRCSVPAKAEKSSTSNVRSVRRRFRQLQLLEPLAARPYPQAISGTIRLHKDNIYFRPK
ncbi:hypothetical protein HK102_006949, partial [Quaeritorhiza haematococci]